MKIFIIGVGLTEIKSHWDANSAMLAQQAVREALNDANLEPKDIGGIITTPQGYFTDAKDIDRFAPQRMGEYLNINARVQVAVDIGGMSSLAALKYGAYEILLEKCGTLLIYASESL
ncbi:MAG: hypothetical protein KIH08_09650 [Candidatus Freyarchaeota archaeon]|nr:hypothetical protein [Candidatus Jordarchaeia archaeon]MBS7268033.1 hypothetical protein [Candidatus Jordarchaeia archaeon]MBS7278908.1 hypothetical protein [Candidatus Jordarchaeia archaeon]